MILSLSGKAGVGKDEVASIIQKLTTPKPYRNVQNEFGNDAREYGGKYILEEEKSPWVIKKWAGVLRKVTSIMLGMDEAFTYTDEFKAMTLPEEWQVDNPYEIPYTGRFFLQVLGTDSVRNGLHPNAWVNALMSGYKPSEPLHDIPHVAVPVMPLWIISDTRFPNELKAVKDKNGITIRINRDLPTADYKTLEQLHPSETALDDAEFDYVIDNNGTIEELEEKVRQILLKEGILPSFSRSIK